MASNPVVPVNVEMNDALQKAIAEATHPDVIKARVHEALEQQVAAKAEADAAAAKATEDAAAAKAAVDAAAAADANASKVLTRTENINGVNIDFTGASEAELDRAVLNAYKIASAFRPNETTPTVDPAIAQKAAADAAAAKAAADAELELRFKRGELSASQYLEQSGAVAEYLAKQGIPVEELRAQVEQSRGNKEIQSWEQATEEFKRTIGADWPGGERNREILGYKLAELGLTETTDKVAALGQAFAAMKASKMIFNDDGTQPTVTPTVAAVTPAAAVVTPAAAVVVPPAAVVPAQTAPRSSGFFGASSGVGGDTTVGAAESKSPVQVPANATPAEIMALYNESLRREGKNPNDEFMRQFASKAR